MMDHPPSLFLLKPWCNYVPLMIFSLCFLFLSGFSLVQLDYASFYQIFIGRRRPSSDSEIGPYISLPSASFHQICWESDM